MARNRATSFKKVVICHTNDFGPNVNDKIKVWIEANGGTFSKELTSDVTHLVCSKNAWKQCHAMVKRARQMKTIFVVKYDWLEDSLLKKPVRALPVRQYLWEHPKFDLVKWVKKNRKQTIVSPSTIPCPKQIQLTGAAFDQAKREFEKDMGTAGFHPYSDSTGFVYIVNLLRKDIVRGCLEQYKIKVGHDPPSIPYDIVPGVYTTLHLLPVPESFSAAPVVCSIIPNNLVASSNIHLARPWAQCLQLFESDAQPYTYACYVQYTRPRLKTATVTLAPPGSTWEFAWTMFEKRYRAQVGTVWDERPGRGTEINLDGEDEHWHYQTPSLKEPEGLRGSLDEGEGATGIEEQPLDKGEGLPQNFSGSLVAVRKDDDNTGIDTHAVEHLEAESKTSEVDDTHLP